MPNEYFDIPAKHSLRNYLLVATVTETTPHYMKLREPTVNCNPFECHLLNVRSFVETAPLKTFTWSRITAERIVPDSTDLPVPHPTLVLRQYDIGNIGDVSDSRKHLHRQVYALSINTS